MLKRLFIILSLTVAFCLVFPNYRKANSLSNGYLRVITEDTAFYSDEKGENFLFYLPYTYYVKPIAESNGYTHIEIESGNATIDGFVKADELYEDGQEVKYPYPEITVTTSSNASLFSDTTLSSTVQYIFPSRQLFCYGKATAIDGSNLYFVNYNNKLGYIKEESVFPFSFSIHPNKLTFLKEDEPSSPAMKTVEEDERQEKERTDVTTLRIAIISCLSLAGILGLIFAVKNKPDKLPNANNQYYDENDYE